MTQQELLAKVAWTWHIVPADPHVNSRGEKFWIGYPEHKGINLLGSDKIHAKGEDEEAAKARAAQWLETTRTSEVDQQVLAQLHLEA